MKTPLQNGDWVEVLTSPAAKPSRDWLSFAVTSRAKNKIRHFIHAQEKEKSIEIGRKLLEKEFKRFKRSVKKMESDGALADLLPDLGLSKIEDLYAALGFGKLAPRSIVEKLVPADEITRAPAPEPESVLGRAARKILPFASPTVEVVGYDDLLASLAKCCNPLPGEPIVGYVTRGRGVSVHASTCPNVTSLLYDPDRQIQVCWSGKKAVGRFPAELRISTEDRSGLLADLTQVIADEKSNIRSIEAKSEAGRGGEIHVVVEIDDVKHLEKILKRLRAVSGVLQVRRQFQRAAAGESTPA